MRTLRILPAAVLLFALIPAPVPAQGDALDILFHFDELSFTLFPHGFESNSGGSGLRIRIENVSIEDDNAIDLRNCIDGQSEPSCSYGDILDEYYDDGDGDRTAEANEITAFQAVVKSAIALGLQIEKLERLKTMLRQNVTLDAKAGGNAKVTEFILRGAEGAISSDLPVYADVTLEMDYPNDKAANAHTLVVKAFGLKNEGFTYATVVWLVHADGETWRYVSDQTKPIAQKNRVTASGWSSAQTTFESSTNGDGLTLVSEKVTTSGGKKKAPGFEVVFVALALLGVALAARRRW